MLRRLVAFVLGYLRIEVQGPYIAGFLNGALERGITLWSIERESDRMWATMAIRDFFALRPVVRATRCRVRIRGRYGWPFHWQRLRRRPVLMAGALACLGFLLWLSGHVWVVEVRISGPKNLDPRAVAAVAAEAGLKPGVWKNQVDISRVQAHLLKRINEVSWAVIRVQGTRFVIEIVEKAAERSGARGQECINLVARKGGVVEQVIPYQGEAAVKLGDVVRKGDLLVECAFKFYPDGRPLVMPGTEKPPRYGIVRTQTAMAEVKARVSYQEYREMSLYKEVPEPTGRTVTRWVLSWQEKPILTGGARQANFARAEERREVYPRGLWRNWKSPVELTLVKVSEIQVRREPVTLQQAVQSARAQMQAQLRWILGPSDRVLRPLQVRVAEQHKDRVGLVLTVETLEEISEPRPGQPTRVEPPQPAKP